MREINEHILHRERMQGVSSISVLALHALAACRVKQWAKPCCCIFRQAESDTLCSGAGGDFIANFTISQGSRLENVDGAQSAPMIAGFYATCRNGQVLPYVSVPRTSQQYTVTYGGNQTSIRDWQAQMYQYYVPAGQQDLSLDNSYGFRAAWFV